jgi:prepilin-type N-terminal cleavage/methylation domain-containing protein
VVIGRTGVTEGPPGIQQESDEQGVVPVNALDGISGCSPNSLMDCGFQNGGFVIEGSRGSSSARATTQTRMPTENRVSAVKYKPKGLEQPEGYSLVELLVVISVIAIVTAIAVFSFTNTREKYNADDAANKVMNYFREANSKAVSNHHSYRVTINNSTNVISLIDEVSLRSGNNDGETISGDDVLVKQEPVGVRVLLTQPTTPNAVNPPPAPFNYAAATFPSNVWTAHFQSDGSVTDVNLAPMSCTMFFQPIDQQNVAQLIRAVTLFGPSGSIRFWAYNGTQLVQG